MCLPGTTIKCCGWQFQEVEASSTCSYSLHAPLAQVLRSWVKQDCATINASQKSFGYYVTWDKIRSKRKRWIINPLSTTRLFYFCFKAVLVFIKPVKNLYVTSVKYSQDHLPWENHKTTSLYLLHWKKIQNYGLTHSLIHHGLSKTTERIRNENRHSASIKAIAAKERIENIQSVSWF